MSATETRDQLRFLFGTGHPSVDVDDDDALIDHFESVLERDNPDRSANAELVAATARHILDGNADLWAAAQRLTASGLERRAVLVQLSFAMAQSFHHDHDHDHDDPDHVHVDVDPFDPIADRNALRAVLDCLPLADDDALIEAIEAVVAVRPLLPIDAVAAAALGRLGLDVDNELLIEQVEQALDAGSVAGVLRHLPGDLIAHVPTLTAGVVLTHRLTEAEVSHDLLTCISSDLTAFSWFDELTLVVDGSQDPDRVAPAELDQLELDPAAIDVTGDDDGLVHWQLPEGSLAGCRPGEVIAVRVDPFQNVTIDRIDEPDPDPTLVAWIRAAYDAENDEVVMANSLVDLLTTTLAAHPDAFAAPRPPLTELCIAAGLEVRGGDAGDGPEAWAELRRSERTFRLMSAANGHGTCARSAEEVLELFDEELGDDASVKNALRLMEDDHVAELVVDELIDPDGVSADADNARAMAERLVSVAKRGRQTGVACWVRGLVDERSGNPVEAEQWFVKGLAADPDAGVLIDRLAWYASDRGDAATASRLLRQLEDDNGEADVVAAFARDTHAGLGRNDPCWCGSGRKFKQCHLGVVVRPPLADRVGWISHKAFAYLRRHGGEAVGAIVSAAAAWAGDDVGAVREALDDPIVFDTVLVEGGGWHRFLADRGPLLPVDELELVQQWLPIQRSVYEVVAVHRGSGADVRDLRTGDVVGVAERSSSPAWRAGILLLGRAVPDGSGHQFVGALMSIPDGQQHYALELCDDADGDALCGYAGALATR